MKKSRRKRPHLCACAGSTPHLCACAGSTTSLVCGKFEFLSQTGALGRLSQQTTHYTALTFCTLYCFNTAVKLFA